VLTPGAHESTTSGVQARATGGPPRGTHASVKWTRARRRLGHESWAEASDIWSMRSFSHLLFFLFLFLFLFFLPFQISNFNSNLNSKLWQVYPQIILRN
jgi:hypothetical protein